VGAIGRRARTPLALGLRSLFGRRRAQQRGAPACGEGTLRSGAAEGLPVCARANPVCARARGARGSAVRAVRAGRRTRARARTCVPASRACKRGTPRARRRGWTPSCWATWGATGGTARAACATCCASSATSTTTGASCPSRCRPAWGRRRTASCCAPLTLTPTLPRARARPGGLALSAGRCVGALWAGS